MRARNIIEKRSYARFTEENNFLLKVGETELPELSMLSGMEGIFFVQQKHETRVTGLRFRLPRSSEAILRFLAYLILLT
jgi:hypothetical protein